MSAAIIDFRAVRDTRPDVDTVDAPSHRADVAAVAGRLRATYLQAFDDVVAVALRWEATGERHRTEENSAYNLGRTILRRVLAEGHLARLQRHAARFSPESLAKQMPRILHNIEFDEHLFVLLRDRLRSARVRERRGVNGADPVPFAEG